MIKCLCGKEITTVPDWLATVKVQFICNNCPSRDLQGITQVDFSSGRIEEEAKKTVDDGPEEIDLDEDEEED